jgi:hypothetical protein
MLQNRWTDCWLAGNAGTRCGWLDGAIMTSNKNQSHSQAKIRPSLAGQCPRQGAGDGVLDKVPAG